ncbi:MAG: N-acyl-D-amino-acid deacylase family protein [Acetivibrio ethanolgignens]
MLYDFILENGRIVDGTGGKPYFGDICVSNGKIAAVFPADSLDANSALSKASQVYDVHGAYITPGFIDIHRHADVNLFTKDFGKPELHQGLTTIINGNCGLSVVPCPPQYRNDIYTMLQPVIGEVPADKEFSDFEEYMGLVKKQPLPLNVGMDIGNGTVRAAVRGYRPGKLTREEVKEAQDYIRSSLKAGALAVTLGIVYSPENCYDKDDFVEVLKPMTEFDVPLVTHIRGEGDLFLESLEEVIYIAKKLSVHLHVSHFKCIGKRNWGHVTRQARALLDKVRKEGLPVTCDVYPYTAGSTQLIQILPPEYIEGGAPGIVSRLKNPVLRKELREILSKPSDTFENLVSSIGWENIRMSTLTLPEHAPYSGKSITEIAKMQGKDPFDCACDMLIAEECRISMVDFIVSEEDIRENLQYPYSAIISDSVYPTGGVWHPRLFAAFPKVLKEYVHDEPVLTIENAIRKMTGFPADIYHLKGKGYLKEGFDADINVFSLENISPKATYENPNQFSSGFDYIFINGQLVLKDDCLTDALAGQVILASDKDSKAYNRLTPCSLAYSTTSGFQIEDCTSPM